MLFMLGFILIHRVQCFALCVRANTNKQGPLVVLNKNKNNKNKNKLRVLRKEVKRR